MKFVINEHRLDKLILDFIDDYIRNTFERSDLDNFIVYYINEYEYDDVKIEYDSEDGRLYIERDFLMLISDMFGLTPEEGQHKIKEWFEFKEGITPKYLHS